MQNVGEHMDELFRKAADNYMLKEGKSNWNEISGQLESSIAPVTTTRKNNKASKYFITGSLLLLCFAAGILFNKYAFKNEAVPVTTKYQESSADNYKVNKDLPLPGSKALQQDKVVAETQTKKAPILNNIDITPTTANQGLTKCYSAYKPDFDNNTQNAYAPSIGRLLKLHVIKDKMANTIILAREAATSLNNKPVDVKGSLSTDSVSKYSLIKLTENAKNGMYYGLLAGAGFNTIKNQSFTRPGFDIGFVAGYQLSARSSVEMNVLYTHKYYYTDGKYFSMDKIKNDMPADMKVMSVKGSISIFEIPLKFRYNLIQKDNSAVYASAGVSSYILVNEKNNYVTSTNGTMGNMNGNYTTTAGYFAGALNISAGYAHTIGKNNTIRFEPYATIPMKGIGIGSLPVTTSGLHVLFTIAPHK